jgi:predicted PurR-regulated permease PerM
MDLSQIALNQGLTFLAWGTLIVLIVIAVFLVKLLMDLSTLIKNVNETSLMLNTELKPTLDELQETLKSVNSIIRNTDNSMVNLKGAVENTLGRTKAFTGSLFSGLINGFGTMWRLFSKK